MCFAPRGVYLYDIWTSKSGLSLSVFYDLTCYSRHSGVQCVALSLQTSNRTCRFTDRTLRPSTPHCKTQHVAGFLSHTHKFLLTCPLLWHLCGTTCCNFRRMFDSKFPSIRYCWSRTSFWDPRWVIVTFPWFKKPLVVVDQYQSVACYWLTTVSITCNIM